MSVAVLILGLLLVGAGALTIAFGIPINEFSLGNTLIVAGTTLVAAGWVLVGLAAAVDQLSQIAKALRPRAGARPALQPQATEQAIPVAARPAPPPLQPPAYAPPPPAPVKPPKPAMPVPPRPPIFAKP